MQNILGVLTASLIFAFFWCVGMFVFAFTRNDRRGTAYFAIFTGALMLYVLGYAIELNLKTVREVMLVLRVENLGIPLIAPLFFLTALGLFHPKLLRPWMLFASLSYGAFIFLAVFFNDAHHLYYSSVDMVYNGVFYAVKLGKGPLYILNQAVVLSLSVLLYTIMIIRFVRGVKKMRNRIFLFFIGSAFGLAANIANVLQVVPLGIDITPFAMTIGLMFFAVNIQKHKLMEIVPAAFSTSIEGMDDALIVLDDEWSFVHCNEKAKQLFPGLREFSGTEDVTKVPNWPEDLNPAMGTQNVFSMVDPETGQKILNRVRIEDVCRRKGKKIGISINIHDITDITNLLNRLEELAVTDSLTGVFNRRHFIELVKRQMEMSRRHNFKIGILMIDVDHFKQVNDTYSHPAGDYVLCKIVAAVVKQLGPHDVIARYGGEEFMILSDENEEKELLYLAERLRAAIEKECIVFEGKSIPVTASFGAVMISPGQTYEKAIEMVDKALYIAKNNGRNCVAIG